MNNLFRIHKEISEQEYTTLWNKGLFVFDTNVLLDLYRLPAAAREDLLTILSDDKIKARIWLPFQVSLEYMYNKLEAIGDQKNKFTSVKEIINTTLSQINTIYSELNTKIVELQLKKRHSAINPDAFINENLFKAPSDVLKQFLKHLNDLDKKQPDVDDKDEIKEQISLIFKNKIGDAFTNAELEKIYTEGEVRYKDNLPPGYKDKSKDGFYSYEDRKIYKKYGDLIIWKEIIKKCTADKLDYIILVTGDTKEDWWLEKRGRKIGPRYELLNEIYYHADSVKVFHMYNTSSFMQYAKQYLKIDVKEQSIEQTKDLLKFSNRHLKMSRLSKGLLSVIDLAKSEIEYFPTLKLSVVSSLENIPYLIVDPADFHTILLDIFTNVKLHSLSNKIRLEISDSPKGLFLELKFKNEVGNASSEIIEKGGLLRIRSIMTKYGIAKFAIEDGQFVARLKFRKKNTAFGLFSALEGIDSE